MVLEAKGTIEHFEKLAEEKVCKDSRLDVFGELFVEVYAFLVLECDDSIMFPAVFKVIRYFVFEFLIYIFFSVKLSQNSKEL